MKKKKVVLLVNTLLCSHFIYATDYITPITGPKTFNDGDRVILSESGINGAIRAVWDNSTSDGVHVNNNGAVTIDVTSKTANATGLTLFNGAKNDLGTGSTIIVNSPTSASRGVEIAAGSSTSLEATNLKIEVAGGASQSGGASENVASAGIYNNSANVKLKGESFITVINGRGVVVSNGASFSADKINIDVSGDGRLIAAVYTTANTTTDLGEGSTLKTSGSNVNTIRNIDGQITGKNLTIINNNTAGSNDDSKAIDVSGGKVDIDGGSVTSNGSYGVVVWNRGTFNYKNGSITANSSSTPVYGLGTQEGAVANLDNVTVGINGNSSRSNVIWSTGSTGSTSGGRVNANNTTINANGAGTYGIAATNQGQVTLTGNTVINAAQSKVAIIASNFRSQVNTGSSGSKMAIKGGLYAQSGGLLDLQMLQGSTLEGRVYTDNTSTTNLNMTGTRWDMTDGSSVTHLATDNSHINFLSSANNYKTLLVSNLSGNSGNFSMNVNLGGINTTTDAAGERVGKMGVDGDLLAVTNSMGAGDYRLSIANNGASTTQGNEVLQVVVTPTNNTGNVQLNAPVEAGAYEYGLRQSGTTNKNGWELYSTGQRTTTAEAATSFLNTNYLLSYVDTQTLLQRMGELRRGEAKNQEGNFWIRGFGGKLSSFAGQQLSGFDMTYSGTQLGVDKQLDSNLGQVYVGVMAGMTHANPNYRGGDGTTKDYHFGLYGTLLTDNGYYIDAVAKYTYMKNHFSVKDTQGSSVKGKGNSSGYNVSLEAGKRFHLNATAQAGGLYLEPQAQITYGYQGGMPVNASNGLKVDLGNYNYTLGRMSSIVGYEITGNNPINVYVKTGYVREMDSSTSYKLNGQRNNYDFRGGWWDNSVGVTAQINKRHNIYADVTYAKGSRFDQKQLNVGYRYSF